MGRKATKGNRSAGSGRKKKASTVAGRTKYDYGNDRVRERLERFRHPNILDGKAQWIDIFDGIGQLHAVGLLEGHGLDGKLLREAGREYIGLYNYVWIDLLPKGSDLERAYGGRISSGKSDLIPEATARETRFEKFDKLLPLRSPERYWTQAVLLDYFGLDTVHPLVDRLVNFKLRQWSVRVHERGDRDLRVAGTDDFAILAVLLRGLFALADGAMPGRKWGLAA